MKCVLLKKKRVAQNYILQFKKSHKLAKLSAAPILIPITVPFFLYFFPKHFEMFSSKGTIVFLM